MANNSLDFVQFLGKKTPPPHQIEFWVTLCIPEPIFFRKTALYKLTSIRGGAFMLTTLAWLTVNINTPPLTSIGFYVTFEDVWET
jgi:hypothetical protein